MLLVLFITGFDRATSKCDDYRIQSPQPHCPKISGSPFLLLPITTTFEFALLARVSVASIPFHSNNEGVMPWATICWKSRTPAASMRLR